MALYPIYLEIGPDGTTMAHSLDLPGCTLRAASPEEATRGMPAAIASYLSWLRRHGEAVPDAPIEVQVAGETRGLGPFNPGDAAALFPPDLAPITPADMERYFRLMEYSRADLLALTGGLPDDCLDWQPDEHSFCIRRILRHIGNAEEWYVSRLVDPKTLPVEWNNDEGMPIHDFLEMSRRTAVARMRGLSDEERSSLFRPSIWTSHADEEWTARKSLRRFIEHEQEHTNQIRQVLSARQRLLLAHQAAARSQVWEAMLWLSPQTMSEATACGDAWTNQDVLVHLAGWDRYAEAELRKLLAGAEPDVEPVRDINGYNAKNVAAGKGRSLDQVVEETLQARTSWVEWMKGLAEDEFFHRHSVGKGHWSPPVWIEILREHDVEHAHMAADWREGRGHDPAGARSVLLAATDTFRTELLLAIGLVPEEGRATIPISGEWTLQDVLGHIADWEQLEMEGLRQMAAGQAPQVEHVTDIDIWNRAHAEARRGQPWETVWTAFQETHQAVMDLLSGFSQERLGQGFPGVWEDTTNPYAWVIPYLQHDREHAEDIRKAMVGVDRLPEESSGRNYTQRGK